MIYDEDAIFDRDALGEWLGADADEIAELVRLGVLHETAPGLFNVIATTRAYIEHLGGSWEDVLGQSVDVGGLETEGHA